jgi:hypothetical protein
MTVIIEIRYAAASRGYQKGDFQVRGREKEQVALDCWKQIKKELSYRAELEKVLCNGDDITQLVKNLEAADRKRKDDIANDYLPF